uniref:Secreted protein n=1 Tax=Rhizophora mucronata TaxID=61149 RepID=A0A2P2K495_RHIMU
MLLVLPVCTLTCSAQASQRMNREADPGPKLQQSSPISVEEIWLFFIHNWPLYQPENSDGNTHCSQRIKFTHSFTVLMVLKFFPVRVIPLNLSPPYLKKINARNSNSFKIKWRNLNFIRVIMG